MKRTASSLGCGARAAELRDPGNKTPIKTQSRAADRSAPRGAALAHAFSQAPPKRLTGVTKLPSHLDSLPGRPAIRRRAQPTCGTNPCRSDWLPVCLQVERVGASRATGSPDGPVHETCKSTLTGGPREESARETAGVQFLQPRLPVIRAAAQTVEDLAHFARERPLPLSVRLCKTRTTGLAVATDLWFRRDR